MRLQKSATHKRYNGFVYKMFNRKMTSKTLVYKNMTFILKRIIGCNLSMTVFITHGHRIVWWESVKTWAECMSGSHLISWHDI